MEPHNWSLHLHNIHHQTTYRVLCICDTSHHNDATHYTAGARVWEGRLEELPAFMGPADAVYLTNSGFLPTGATASDSKSESTDAGSANALSRALLLRLAFLLRPGGSAVCSLPLHNPAAPSVEPGQQRSVGQEELQTAVHDLPLNLTSWTTVDDRTQAILQVSEHKICWLAFVWLACKPLTSG